MTTTIHVVRGRFPAWEDTEEWPVRAFKDAAKADAFRDELIRVQHEVSTVGWRTTLGALCREPPPGWTHPLDPRCVITPGRAEAHYYTEMVELED